MSMGVDLGNGIILPVGSSGAVCLCLCCFLGPLLSIRSTDPDSYSCHLHDTGEALCFPKDLTSFQRFLSSVLSSDCLVSTLWQQSLSEERFSSRALILFIVSLYWSWYWDSLPWTLSTASSSMWVTTCGHAVRNACLIQWDGIATVRLITAAVACVAYVSQVVHAPLWVLVINPGIPWIVKVCSCSLSLNSFKAPSNWDNPWSSDTSMSGCCGNGSVMQLHLMEVVWVEPQWCLVKHLCSYIFAQIFVTLQVSWWSHENHVTILPACITAGNGCILCLVVLDIYSELPNLYRN